MKKTKTFIYGAILGIVEPIGVVIYVVVEDLILESQNGEYLNIKTVGVAIVFVIMIVLNNALG